MNTLKLLSVTQTNTKHQFIDKIQFLQWSMKVKGEKALKIYSVKYRDLGVNLTWAKLTSVNIYTLL